MTPQHFISLCEAAAVTSMESLAQALIACGYKRREDKMGRTRLTKTVDGDLVEVFFADACIRVTVGNEAERWSFPPRGVGPVPFEVWNDLCKSGLAVDNSR